MSSTRARIGQPSNLNQKNEAAITEVRKALTERQFIQQPYQRPFQVFTSTIHKARMVVKICASTGECYIECENCEPQYYRSAQLSTAATIIKQTEYNN